MSELPPVERAAGGRGAAVGTTVSTTPSSVAPVPSPSPRMRAFVAGVDRVVLSIARHWLLALNVVAAAYAGLPVLAPWLLSKGITLPAQIIYFLYSFTCHQLPERSFFIFGYKMCYCERCCAIYSGLLLFGLLFPLLPKNMQPLRWRWMFVLWVPMALDGFTQLFGLRESTWQLRVITGILFALSLAWVGFPHLRKAFGTMRHDLEARLLRGGAQPIAPPV